jgi:hypothetical protein
VSAAAHPGRATLIVAGQRVSLLERIPVCGRLLGLGSKASAYRAARSGWPLVGPESSKFVVVSALMGLYGIPYSVESDDPAELGVVARDGAAPVSADSSRTIDVEGETHARDARG